ncbi:pyridine nucleotide-disulfide oxidoreductase [Paractinoplanes brasiliensis]|uniref:Pyridine nucleotide-disulfide oxidoreductase n=1 Tax=Paractinoplanes brasiliensis TaxID=52695 RepID=A0A4V3C5Z0_9ACTN|nr:pyridine nucleotide-disulfide oxidoreductase [Actinoplanes brasiliensis]GID30728.1 oxidoreductase [Actinoplanes brasiliensis]
MVVIGGGQSGLSAAYHLLRRGFTSALESRARESGGLESNGLGSGGAGSGGRGSGGSRSGPGNGGFARGSDAAGSGSGGGERTFVVLDAGTGAGGAWRHRWESLRMGTVNGIFDLPGLAQPEPDPAEPSRTAVPRYFEAFERRFDPPILRPVTVTAVHDKGADGLLVESSAGRWTTGAIINATGTWTNPVLPYYPGRETFAGVQLHTRDYVSAERFAGKRVAVVGGGISAFQHLEEISRVATTFWYTRRVPVFRTDGFEPEAAGRDVIARVTADVEAGRPTGSVVSYTGLLRTAFAAEAERKRRPMFTAIEPYGVRESDGSFTSVDVILWATGFKAALAHLDPLGLRNADGGIRMSGTMAAAEPRVHLIGFGPSQSTVGANRAGRDAVAAIVRAGR